MQNSSKGESHNHQYIPPWKLKHYSRCGSLSSGQNIDFVMGKNQPRTQGNDQRITRKFQNGHLNLRVSNRGFIKYNKDEFVDLKFALNKSKSGLDKYYLSSKSDVKMERNWRYFQNIIDIYKPMRGLISKQFNARHVTNAWMKYWEIYSYYDLLPKNSETTFTAFFNAELPGAALCAFNHWMKTNKSAAHWWASSLVGDGALKDAYGLYEKNRENWLMNENNNGDSISMSNIRDFASRIGIESEYKGVDLYSHDAGIDVSEIAGELSFNEQESANAQLHLGCAIAGFMTMRQGASFIAKQYTYFEEINLQLIAIYSTLFEEFWICKPMTSRPYNSEIYLVGKKFKGISDETLALLTNKLENFNTDNFSEYTKIDGVALGEINNKKLGEIVSFGKVVFGQQIDMIDENIQLFQNHSENLYMLQKRLEHMYKEKSNEWLKVYPILRIDNLDQLNSI